MRAVLIQHGLWKVLSGPHTEPSTMTEEQWAEQKKKKHGSLTDNEWEELEEKALSTIQLCVAPHVLWEVLDKATAVGLWVRLEEFYITKSLTNKIRLKERLYTFKMTEGTPVQKHLNDFNSITVDLENLDVKIEDEDKAILLVVSLPSSFINTSRKFCCIATTTIYLLRMLSLTYYPNKSLILKCVLMTKQKV